MMRYKTTFSYKYYRASSDYLHKHLYKKFVETKLHDMLPRVQCLQKIHRVYSVT